MADNTVGAFPEVNGRSTAGTSKAVPAPLHTIADAHTPEPVNGSAGQPLTHYHSLFSDLVSWKNPRDSAIAYASIVSTIMATRYLDLVRWSFKLTWMVLAATIAAEVGGRFLLNQGLTSQFRPRKYYTMSRETVDGLIGDVHELVNFFAIEAQRILFAENISASAAACAAAFISYFLIKFVPSWGLAVIATTVAFFAPLVYTSNQELIDQHLKNASDVINSQTAQVRTAAQKQAGHLTTIGKQYAGDYTEKVQEILRTRSVSPSAVKKPVPAQNAPQFPSPPTEEPEKIMAEPTVPEEPVFA